MYSSVQPAFVHRRDAEDAERTWSLSLLRASAVNSSSGVNPFFDPACFTVFKWFY